MLPYRTSGGQLRFGGVRVVRFGCSPPLQPYPAPPTLQPPMDLQQLAIISILLLLYVLVSGWIERR